MRRAAQSLPCLIICLFAAGLMLMAASPVLAQEDQPKEDSTEEPAKQEPSEEAQPEEAQPEETIEAEEKTEDEPLEGELPKEEPGKEETSAETDEKFAKSFIGRNYQGGLEIDGWADLGGGLVLPPIYVYHYQRDDGTFLVLTSREVTPPTRTSPAAYVVADALIVPKPKEGVEFTIACVQGEDETLRFLGLASGKEDKEWWTDVRRAWEVSTETGKIAEAKTRGVRCTNISWGQ
jgi:hypothetical protein